MVGLNEHRTFIQITVDVQYPEKLSEFFWLTYIMKLHDLLYVEQVT